jgi:hypothetical protein
VAKTRLSIEQAEQADQLGNPLVFKANRVLIETDAESRLRCFETEV